MMARTSNAAITTELSVIEALAEIQQTTRRVNMKKKVNRPENKAADQTATKPAAQINDLPPTSEQAQEVKGGLPAVQKVRDAASRAQSSGG